MLWKKEYEKQTGDKTLEQFRQNFDRRRKANNTTKENADKKMTSAMYDYKTAFDFGAAATLEAYPEVMRQVTGETGELRASEIMKKK